MSLPTLDNLVRTGQLKAEPRNESEVRRMLAMARIRLDDAQLASLSAQGRFTSAYYAAHAAALAALRWHGYRSENRYAVFQCLTHTLNWSAPRWRVLDAATRNGIWLSTRGFWKWRNPLLPSYVSAADMIADAAKLVE